ncbi:FAD-binding protein [Acidimicrobiia bacterium EGI L10123]|uniref:FAD-binding oxidoreductase n=1 Tax=Salinilacustrithrix flava TaxID=2957203 RepID=UPI003D7C168C|nr:FAD-binding protein [Acidimicrobiia bacterium EGI L10123]
MAEPGTVDVVEVLRGVVPEQLVRSGADAGDDFHHDEALGIDPVVPAAVVTPETEEQVAAVLAACDANGIPVTARGSGTGLSGAAIPRPDGAVIAFDRMAEIIEIDEDNLVAVVQPGVTLDQLDQALAPRGLVYPVFPGEYSASLGGNVATNAGGMRAVKYGVTRHQVLGLRAVLPSGEVVTTGGKFVKGSTGYDLTQLIVGSEGTLAVVTQAILKLYPRPEHRATVLAPFTTLDQVTAAVPAIVKSGIGPMILEYIDMLTMSGIENTLGVEVGVPEDIKATALAYLVVQLEDRHEDRLESDIQALAELVADLGAIDVYVLPSNAATQLIEAREKAFWLAKGAGADDIIDVVVPRASIDSFLTAVSELAQAKGTFIAGCGHAGDGNVHLSVFQPDPDVRYEMMLELFRLGMDHGGAISGEHGLGRTKAKYWLELEDPTKVALMRRIKAAFDPNGILNPGALFGETG